MLASLIAVLPLLLVGLAHAQPVLPPLAPAPDVAGVATPVCAGESMKKNAPDVFAGTDAAGARWVVAWCQMVDGGSAGWVRMQPAGTANAPVVWLTDTAPRTVPSTAAYSVVLGTSGDLSRPAYAVAAGALGKANGQRAAGGVACACDLAIVKQGSSTYCPFAPVPIPTSVALCKPIATPKEAARAMPTLHELEHLRNPMHSR